MPAVIKPLIRKIGTNQRIAYTTHKKRGNIMDTPIANLKPPYRPPSDILLLDIKKV